MSRALLSTDRMNWDEYATADDFQKLFAPEMVDLFRLAFLRTADAEKAERCLILTMHERMATGDVFKGWLPVWARNALIRNGVEIVTGNPLCSLSNIQGRDPFPAMQKSRRSVIRAFDDSLEIMQLRDFDRLVYVICVLERHPNQDCAVLLGRSRQEVRDAQKRAWTQIAAFEHEPRRATSEASAGR